MNNIVKGLIALAVVAFALAVVASLGAQTLMGTSAEGFSRASSNLSLLAIAALLAFRPDSTPS